MSSHLRWLVLILVLTAFSIWVALPDTKISNVDDSCYRTTNQEIPTQGLHLDFNNDCEVDVNLNVQQSLGLDLVGGLRVLMEAELPIGSFTRENLQDTANGVGRRVNGLGLTEATVQVQGSNRILVELPGVRDSQQAIQTIQQTALLEFVDFSGLASQARALEGQKIITTEQLRIKSQREQTAAAEATAEPTSDATAEATNTPESTPEATPQVGTQPPANPTTPEVQGILNPLTNKPFDTIMTGAGLQAASAQYGAATQGTAPQWYIRFELNTDGSSKFGPFTAAHINEPMAIVLDGVVLSAPTIQAKLDTGGVITGNFTQAAAQQLALQLRSGALPIPLRVISADEVGATLGQESVRLSIRAGIIGVAIVLSFMLINYRVPGVAADLALLVFVLLNLALFKLIPITLTLPSIVGFLISIGTAVDGNILIFERLREELRAGTEVDKAIDAGFARAWNSIRDSNISTILISSVLFFFGQTPGASIVSGFAVTLILGLVLNLFTAIIVTRTFLHLILWVSRKSIATRTWLLGV